VVLLREGKVLPAKQAFEAALTLDPFNPQVLSNMEKLQEFNSRQAGGALVGEWSLAGTEYDETYTPEEKADRLRELALWVVRGFMERSNGCLYWNLDANYTEWSYERSTSAYSIDWAGMAKPTR